MEKDLKEFIALRCERALEGDENFMHDEASGEFEQDELSARSQTICYLQGFRDVLQFMGVDEAVILSIIGSRGSQIR